MRSFLFLVFSLLFEVFAFATPSPEAKRQEQLIEIHINSSRSQPVVGTGFQITADIKNVSNQPIYLDPQFCVLSRPPEVQAGSGNLAGESGTFPTRPIGSVQTIAIAPGDSYRVVWLSDVAPDEPSPANSNVSTQQQNLTSPTPAVQFSKVAGSLRRQIIWELGFLLFTPGDYTMTVQVHYWTDPGFPPNQYRIAVGSAVMHVIAPQSVRRVRNGSAS